MTDCPKCSRPVPPGDEACPECGEPLAAAQGELFELVDIFKVPDEITGLAVRSFLAENDIEAVLQNMQASFYAGTLNLFLGYWGKLLVPKEQEAKARSLLAEFFRDFQGK